MSRSTAPPSSTRSRRWRDALVDRKTIQAYDRQAAYWMRTRSRSERTTEERAAATAFRVSVGQGLVLDLGCGPARFLDVLEPAVGVDASAGMLDQASRPARLVQGDLESLPLRDRCIAGVFANYSLQHVPSERLPATLRELARVLHPGGALELTIQQGVYEGDDLADDDLPGRWFSYWTWPRLERELERAGFEERSVEDHDSWLRAHARAGA